MFTKQFARSIEVAVTSKPHIQCEVFDIENNHYWRRLLLYSYVSQRGFVADQIIIQLKVLLGLPPTLDYIYSKDKCFVNKALKWLEFFGLIKQRRFRSPLISNKKHIQDTYELITNYEKIMMKNLINASWVEYDTLTGYITISGKTKKLHLKKSINKDFMEYIWGNQNQRLSYATIKREIKFKGAKFAPSKYIKEIGIEKFITSPDKGVLIFKAPKPQNWDKFERKILKFDKKVTK